MARDFSDVIFETLQQMGPDALTDAGRFSSAVQDMAAGFDAEKRFMSRTFDQKFLDICAEASRIDSGGIGSAQIRAKEYLKREYMVSEEWADAIASSMTLGIERYYFPDRRQEFRRPQIEESPAAFAASSQTVSLEGPAYGESTVRRTAARGERRSAGAAPEARRVVPAGYVPLQQHPTRNSAPSGGKTTKKFLLIVICAAIIFGGGIGALVYTLSGGHDGDGATAENAAGSPGGAGTAPAVTLQASDIAVLNSDINYSQISHQDEKYYRPLTYEGDGVDTLIAVRNDGAADLRCFDFRIRRSDGTDIGSADGGAEFRAYGLVRSGEAGYMYAKIHVPEGTSEQGTIVVDSIVADGEVPDCPGYSLPTGRVLGQSRTDDAYIVDITNDTDYLLHAGAYVVAAGDLNELGGCWGADTLPEDLAPHTSKRYGNMIYNPGWDGGDHDPDWYDVFVIDPACLGVQ